MQYAQDNTFGFFSRLSYFSEKKGYRGREKAEYGRERYNRQNFNVTSGNQSQANTLSSSENINEHCAYYGETDHYLKRYCKVFEKNFSKKRIHLQ